MRISGQKTPEFHKFIKPYLPNEFSVYVEPFGGMFKLNSMLENKPKLSVYNDIENYEIDIQSDKYHNLDFREIFKMYDSDNTFFYIDPPYYKKEFHYNSIFEEKDHLDLHEILEQTKGNWILSYNNEQFIKNLYKKYEIVSYNGNSFRLRNDIIILKNGN